MTTPTKLRPVKGNNCSELAGIIVLTSCLFTAHAQSPPLQLRLESRTNAFELTVSSLSATGALFIYQATNPQTLVDNPSVMFQTNTVSTNDLRVPIAPPGGFASRAFFSAVHWPGLSVADFGDPEFAPDEPSPQEVLITSGVPTNLISGQAFTVDFFVTDTAGQLLDITQAVSIRVQRELDGTSHPNAQVSPSTGQMIGGYLRLTITITATTSLDGYTLGLGPAESLLRNLTQFLKTAFNLGPAPLSTPTSNQLYQTLEARRTASADPNPVWDYPLSGANYPVAGTFGEWRGDDNTRVHKGLDLAAPASASVLASRGGVVSRIEPVSSCMGYYVVIDHGDGWFSRYLHLSPASIVVKVGQSVVRGQPLATSFLSGGCIGTHLHFEIRKGPNQSQWNVPFPGSGQDPLQIATINPGSGIFAVPPGIRPPELEEFGLTGKHPGQNAFVKSTTAFTEATGPVYVYARFLDRELKTKPSSDCDGSYYRLGLRAIGFQPENVATNNWIWPSNEVTIAGYLPASGGSGKGFAKYKIPPNPNRCAYYRYWWKWDTSIYTNATGPRSVVLTGVDYGGAASNYTFTFGPLIIGSVVSNQLVTGQWIFTNVTHLGTNSLPALSQPDRYKMEIIQTKGTVLPGVIWGSPIQNGLTPVLTIHLQTNGYTFTLPAATDTTGLKLRVSSLLVTNLAHEVLFSDMAFIPAGSFTMGDTFSEPPYGYSDELPLHNVYVSAFYIDKYEVTKALWDNVYKWAITHGYSFTYLAQGKAASHPAYAMDWYDAVKWCNARSEKEGRTPAYYTSAAQTTVYRSLRVDVQNDWVKWYVGYRLPTEAEWEKAARGGASGRRFPWADTDTIMQSRENYFSSWFNGHPRYSYDVNPTSGYHPTFNDGVTPYTSPVGYFAPNGYGLYDMAGNVMEWCWDWYSSSYYGSSPGTDPRGPTLGNFRLWRGSGWFESYEGADYARCASRSYPNFPPAAVAYGGFRCVRGL